MKSISLRKENCSFSSEYRTSWDVYSYSFGSVVFRRLEQPQSIAASISRAIFLANFIGCTSVDSTYFKYKLQVYYSIETEVFP